MLDKVVERKQKKIGKNYVGQGSRKKIELTKGKNYGGQGRRKKIKLIKGKNYVGQGSRKKIEKNRKELCWTRQSKENRIDKRKELCWTRQSKGPQRDCHWRRRLLERSAAKCATKNVSPPFQIVENDILYCFALTSINL